MQNTKARRAVVHSSRLLASYYLTVTHSYYLTADVVAGSWRANVHILWIVIEDADPLLRMQIYCKCGRFCLGLKS